MAAFAQTGEVTNTFPAAGYGFLRPDDGGKDRWFHQDYCVPPGVLPQAGARVTYIEWTGPNGKLQATDVMDLGVPGLVPPSPPPLVGADGLKDPRFDPWVQVDSLRPQPRPTFS